MKTSPVALVPPKDLKLQLEMFTSMVVIEEEASWEPALGNVKQFLRQCELECDMDTVRERI